jgi:group I intron endonuclease
MGKEVICGIYKITNPLGKIYIGEAVDIYRRWKHYKGLHCKRQPPIYNSLLKNGVENHTFEIIENCNINELKCRERHWQEFYEVLGKNGLNCQYTECGELKQVHTQETKDKISKANLGKIMSKDSKEKIRIAREGFIFTEQHKKKISIANSGKGNSQFGKKGELSPNFGKEGLRGEKHPNWGRKATQKQKDNQSARQSKLVLNLDTRIFYSSCKEAASVINCTSKKLSAYLNGSRTNKTSFIYI